MVEDHGGGAPDRGLPACAGGDHLELGCGQGQRPGIDRFADAGQVWGDARSSTDPVILNNEDFRSRNWHAGLGGGLQYRHSSSLAARMEVGRSGENVLLYLSISRGF